MKPHTRLVKELADKFNMKRNHRDNDWPPKKQALLWEPVTIETTLKTKNEKKFRTVIPDLVSEDTIAEVEIIADKSRYYKLKDNHKTILFIGIPAYHAFDEIHLYSIEKEIHPIITYAKKTSKDKSITSCEDCGKIVPNTLYCLYCGEPLLAKRKAPRIPTHKIIVTPKNITRRQE